ncbi:MAG: helix-turn-helix domain-containing protein [Steroidobacteraceae bacterium]
MANTKDNPNGKSGGSNKEKELLRKITALINDKGEADFDAESLYRLASRHSTYGTSPTAPVREILHMVGDKWTSLILTVLKSGKCRYSTLRGLVSVLSHESTISHRVLTSKLRLMERDGLVIRKVWPTVPPRVEYESSELGRSLTTIVEALFSWAEVNYEVIINARQGFDTASEGDFADMDQ